jgi:hypothetical protein
LAVTCQFPDSFTVALCSVAPSLGRPPSLEELVSSFHAASLTPCVSVSLSVCPFSSCLPFLFALRAYHFISHVCQIRGRSIVKVSLSRVANYRMSRQSTQAHSNTLVTPFARALAGRLHLSCCHPTIHTARCVEQRQTAQNSPCNQRHQNTTPHLPGIADLQLSDGAFLLASIPALVGAGSLHGRSIRRAAAAFLVTPRRST